ELGFRQDGVLLVTVTMPRGETSNEAVSVTLNTLAEKVRVVPRVQGVSLARRAPQELWPRSTIRTDGVDATLRAERNDVSPEYFEVLDIALLAGRLFTSVDRGLK